MFRLALALGMTVAELETRMTARELAEWQLYDALEPIGGLRTDFGFAMLAALYVNAHKRKNDQPAKVLDFMPFMDKGPPKKQTPQDMMAVLRMAGG
jgi:hypothetical protein